MTPEERKHWIESGKWEEESGVTLATLQIEVKEIDGVLQESCPWILNNHLQLFPINAKRVRIAALKALDAFLDSLGDLNKPI